MDALANLFLDAKCPEVALKILNLASLFWKPGGGEHLLNLEGQNQRQSGGYEDLSIHEQPYSVVMAGDDSRCLMQAMNQEETGLSLLALERHEEAIAVHQEAVALYGERSFGRSWNMGQIGCNLQLLGRHQEAVEMFRRVFSTCKEERNRDGQAWCLGHIGASLFMMGRGDEGWRLLFEEDALSKEKMLRHFSGAIIFQEKKGSPAAAFALGADLLHRLEASKGQLDLTACLLRFFAGLLSMRVQEALLRDICEEALVIFPSPALQIVIRATLATVEYVSGGKRKAFLDKLPPDAAVVVEAMVREGGL